MKKKSKLLLIVLILAVITASVCLIYGKNNKFDFRYWEQDAASLAALEEYVTDVTDENSENFIPAENRIAVFDLDGTLYCEKAPIYLEWLMFAYRVLEDSSYEASADLIAVADEITEAGKTGVIPEDLELKHALANAKAFADMTIEEYNDYVAAFIRKNAQGFTDMTYAQAWYLPMLEVVDYLNANGFTVYICSGTDRFMCRALADGNVNIPKNQIIGMDVLCVADGQGETDGLEYAYTEQDEVIRSDKLIIKNVKANKVSQMIQEIGVKPVLSFGNSSGDISMATYTTAHNPYRSMAFMVVADDTEREYGDTAKAQELREKWDSCGWVSISMKDDWSTIYGKDNKRK